MKKVAFVFLLASFSSLVAAAGNDIITKPGDPIKGQPTPQQPAFSLSKGYFSLFDIFKVPVAAPKPDTMRTKFTVPADRSKNFSQKKITTE